MPSTSSASLSRKEPPATPSLSASLQYDSPIQLRVPEISSRGKVSNRERPKGRSLGRGRSSGCRRSAVQSATPVADESDDESITLNRQENDDPEDEFQINPLQGNSPIPISPAPSSPASSSVRRGIYQSGYC